MFTVEEKSSFKYWFAHWCAFQMTALNLRVWKLKYLFHDIEKPFLKLFLPYEKVRKIHRKHNKHHPEWLECKLNDNQSPKKINKLLKKYDWTGTIIDWECSRFTKEDSKLNAYDTYRKRVNLISSGQKYPNIYKYCYERFTSLLLVELRKLNLDPLEMEIY